MRGLGSLAAFLAHERTVDILAHHDITSPISRVRHLQQNVHPRHLLHKLETLIECPQSGQPLFFGRGETLTGRACRLRAKVQT